MNPYDPKRSYESKMALTTELKQTQRLIMSPQMQQAIQLLQVPALELAAIIEQEMELNPILEYSDESSSMEERLQSDDQEDNTEIHKDSEQQEMNFDEDNFSLLKTMEEEFNDHWEQSSLAYGGNRKATEKIYNYLENSISQEETLYESLLHQIHETFSNHEDIKIAEWIAGNINSNGFFDSSLEEVAKMQKTSVENVAKILSVIQTFEPLGIGARNLQEALLIQLATKKGKNSFSYQVIEKYYTELLHNQIPAIAKGLHLTIDEVNRIIENDITPLDTHPGLSHGTHTAQPIIPDLSVSLEEDKLIIVVHDEHIPVLKLNKSYIRMLKDQNVPKDTKEFIKQKVSSAKWLLKNIFQRNDTLQRIAAYLVEKQHAFFISPHGELIPLTMRHVAEEIGLHESTVARAVSNKYIDTPRGLMPLRSFFTNAYVNDAGDDISSATVRKALQYLLEHEDKSHPLSDSKLTALLKEKGMHCARRTVTKYRMEMGYGSTFQRKKY